MQRLLCALAGHFGATAYCLAQYVGIALYLQHALAYGVVAFTMSSASCFFRSP